jgi:hypothetical protein
MNSRGTSSLYLAFPWIGVAVAGVLLAVLFGTRWLGGERTSSRWRDPVWLSWMAVVAYLLHNGEEYGLDLLGEWHAFPAALCANLKLPAYPNCPIPLTFYLAVNIPMFWIVGPSAALLARRHPLVGFTLYSVISINGLVHVIAAFVTGEAYNPGLVTALAVFLPLSAWVGHACFGGDRRSYGAMAWLLSWGVILHVILAGSIFMFIHGRIGPTTLVWLQIMNAGLLLLIPWLGEQWRGGVLVRPARA